MLKDSTGGYRIAFLFLGFSQMLGATMALQAIVYRKHNCFRKIEENDAFARLPHQRPSQEGLLANVAQQSGSYTGEFDGDENEEVEIFPEKV
ncbi:unnamed protein product [Rodentolepis nana]|uniref:Uncharacterized protein n=1 Tax=Rodentolepis nana TaxID=102285 RepID=A0A0R3TKC9_RODNA|nr:unnamed protein product [Rodentolepis nana]